MTNMQRCEQGHFYDAARHRRCPACGIPGLDVGYTVPGGAGGGAGPTVPPTAPAPGVNRGAPGGGSPPPPPTRPAAGPQVTQRYNPAQQPDAPTVAFWHRGKKDARAGAVEGDGPEEASVVDPVVGWLVAIDGPAKGRDFRLFSEGNTIGRNTRYRVAIMGDESISAKEPHAILTYDPRSEDAAYFIQPAGTHLLYMIRQGANRREVVLTPTRLQPYDLLEIGRSKLLFVPLCNDWFRWTLSDDEPAEQE
jgi:hypothetical protein